MKNTKKKKTVEHKIDNLTTLVEGVARRVENDMATKEDVKMLATRKDLKLVQDDLTRLTGKFDTFEEEERDKRMKIGMMVEKIVKGEDKHSLAMQREIKKIKRHVRMSV